MRSPPLTSVAFVEFSSSRMRGSCWMPSLKVFFTHSPFTSVRTSRALSPAITSNPSLPYMKSPASSRPSVPVAGSSLIRPVPPAMSSLPALPDMVSVPALPSM